MKNASLVPRGVHSGAPKTVFSIIGDDVTEITYNLTTSMNIDNADWAANNSTITYGRSFSYDGLPPETEVSNTINYPFVSVFY